MPESACTRMYHAFPGRYVFVILGFFGIFCTYTMRVNLSVTMVAMVNTSHKDSHKHKVCVELIKVSNSTYEENLKMRGEFSWSSRTQGFILGSFFIGYIITQIPGGLTAETFGGKWPFALGLLASCIFTLLTPFASRSGVWTVILIRILVGVGEGLLIPAMNCLIGHWVPVMERSRVASIIYMGIPLGTFVSMAVSGFLSGADYLGGWPSAFYVFGAVGLVCFGIWTILAYNAPSRNPRITRSELDTISEGRHFYVKLPSFPWKAVLKSREMWALTIAHFGHNWAFLTLQMEMPTYLSDVLHYNETQAGMLSAAPYLIQAAVTILSGFVADKLREHRKMSISAIRKLFNSLVFYGAGCCLLCAAFMNCNSTAMVALFTVAIGFTGCMNSGFKVTHLDMSPEFAGTLVALTSCIANTTGFLAPAFTSWAIQGEHVLKGWNTCFLTAAGLYFVTGTIYNIFGSAELQNWGHLNINSIDSTKFVEMTVDTQN